MCLSQDQRLRAARIGSLKTQIGALARWMADVSMRASVLKDRETAPSTKNRGAFPTVTTFRMKWIDISILYFKQLRTIYR